MEPRTRQPGDFDPRALFRHRRRAGMTQEELGDAAGVTGEWISQLESETNPAEPSVRLFRRLADALGVQPGQLEVPDPVAIGASTSRVFATQPTPKADALGAA